MEPLLGIDATYTGWSNQMAPILAGLIRLTTHLVDLELQSYWIDQYR